MLRGQIMALCAAMLNAVGTTFFSRMGGKFKSDMICYVRSFLAVPMAMILVFILDGGLPEGYPWQTYAVAFGSGVIGYFLCDYFLFKSIVGLGARETSVIMTLNPALTAVLSFFIFGEALAGKQILGMAVTVLGVALMILGSKGEDPKDRTISLRAGILFAALGAVLQSVADITAKTAASTMPSATTSLVRLTGGLVAWFVFGCFRKKEYRAQLAAFRDWRYVAMMVFATAAGPVFAMTLSIGAMELIPVGVVKSLVQTSPLFLIPIDLLMKKRFSALSVMGTLISVAGVFLLF